MVAPAAYALYLGIAAIVAACSTSTEKAQDAASPFQKDADNVDDSTATDSAHFPDIDSWGELPSPPDTFVETSPAVALIPKFPLQGTPTLFTNSPCGTNSFINDLDDTGIGTCSGGINKVFTLNNKGAGKYGDNIDHETQLDVSPDQVDMDANGDIAITATNVKGEPGTERMYGIAAIPSFLSVGETSVDGQKFVPHFLKGIQKFPTGQMVMVGGDITFKGMNADSYSPGVAIVFEGTSVTPQFRPTQGHNPTSIGSWTQSGVTYVGIVNTEALNTDGKTNGQKSSLTVMNMKTLQTNTPIELPSGGLGVAGELAVAGGFLAIPSADNSGHIYLLNTQNLSATPQTLTIADAAISSGKYLVSFVKILDHYLIAGSYNSSMISSWDLSTTPATPLPALDLGTTGIGDAACISFTPGTPCTLVFAAMDKMITLQ